MIATSMVTFGVVRNNMENIRAHWRQILLWESSQMGIEYMRFRETLLDFARDNNGVSAKEVNRRYNILWSRVVLFQKGNIAERIGEFPQATESIAEIFQGLKAQEQAVVGLDNDHRQAALAIWKQIGLDDEKYRLFNRVVMRGEVQKGTILREGLERNQVILTWLGGGAIFLTLMLLMYFAHETRIQRRLGRENERLFRAAQTANRTKSAFLNMMSHEMRTPMNGILGMIALARQQGLGAQQAQLLGVAEESSQQLNDLLADVIEFADLEGTDLELVNKPFLMCKLCAAVTKAIFSRNKPGQKGFSVGCKGDFPKRLRGDPARLRQALVHLARYLGAVSQRDVQMDLGYENGKFIALLAYDNSLIGRDWQPAFVDQGETLKDEGFSKNELGTEITCGMVNSMAGELIHIPAPEGSTKAVVKMVVPMVAVEQQSPVVRIETRSGALAAICQAVLMDFDVRFFQKGDAGTVHTIIIEAGGEFEALTRSRLVKIYPDANFVALGRPDNAALFDASISLPIDKNALQQASFL